MEEWREGRGRGREGEGGEGREGEQKEERERRERGRGGREGREGERKGRESATPNPLSIAQNVRKTCATVASTLIRRNEGAGYVSIRSNSNVDLAPTTKRRWRR